MTNTVAICGAGPVGQAFALLLLQRGFSANNIVVFDAKTSAQARTDARSIALSQGSQQLLSSIQAAPQIATAITEIHVSRRGHFGRTLIQANDYDLPALGYVARYKDIVAPLEQVLVQHAVPMRRPVHVTHIEELENCVKIDLADGECVMADLLVQAVGGTSNQQEQRTMHHDYQQTALITHVTVSHTIAHRAFERFTDEGPLALLPQEDGYALVWCMRSAHAQEVLLFDDVVFLKALQQSFGQRLGRFLSASPRVAFPLGLNAQTQATARTVNIGNAAQTLHPVAGQGLNLGLRDAYILARCLSSSSSQTTAQTVTQFMQERRTDRQVSIRVTDIMARIFASSPDGSMVQSLLGGSLGAIDLFAPAKKMLAEQMMYGWR